MKSVRVSALHKGEDVSNTSNYRPIPILSVFGKIIERCLYARVDNFLEDDSFFCKSQFRFCKGHSTERTILAVTQFIQDDLDKDEITATTFVDIRKVFDTISSEKLSNSGIWVQANVLIISYLKYRVQRINGGDAKPLFSNQSNSVGPPQGSILGPLLFLLHANNSSNSITKLGLTELFADDTVCIVLELMRIV